MIKFIPTPEQQQIIDRLVEVTTSKKEEDAYFRMCAFAPAGTGKTQLTAGFMYALQIEDPSLKIGYFIFNRFMTEEIDTRTYVMKIENTRALTYHSFFLENIKNNKELKEIFYDRYGADAIDFQKSYYSLSEIRKTCEKLLGDIGIDEYFLKGIRKLFNDWLNTDETREEFALSVAREIFQASEDSGIMGEMIKNKHEIEELLDSAIGIVAGASWNRLNKEEKFQKLFVDAVDDIMKSHRMTHSSYYKAVYEICVEKSIDMFSMFDVVVVDEAQDVDKMFKRLLLATSKPVLVIGDSDQSIYSWRGAVDIMSHIKEIGESYSLSYSFRYANDIAQLSNLIRLRNKESVEVLVTGRYTPKIENINKRLSTSSEVAKTVHRKIQREIFVYDRDVFVTNAEEDLWVEEELTEEEKRDSAVKMIEERKESMKKTARAEYERDLRKHLAKYAKKHKTAYVCRNNSTLISALFSILNELNRLDDIKDNIQIALTSTVSEEFIDIKNLNFSSSMKKAFTEVLGENFDVFKKNKTIHDVIDDERIRRILFQHQKYSFLLDSDSYENFVWLLSQLSSRAKGTISKKDKDATLVFTTVHGSKGKEFDEVYLGADIFNIEDEVTEEEINIAYVAITRAIKSLNFLSLRDNDPHPLHDFFLDNMEDIEMILESKYTYTFPFGVSMEIEKKIFGDNILFLHTIKREDVILGAFMQENPIYSGRILYNNKEPLNTIIYSDKSGSNIASSFDGYSFSYKDKRKGIEYFGVGKTEDSVILSSVG